ncbi:hypothetical protein Bca101_042989 [Brassica carinata]
MATQGVWLRMTSSPKLVAKSTELGFVTSQLSGLRISQGPSSDVSNRISFPSFPGRTQPIVARNFLSSLISFYCEFSIVRFRCIMSSSCTPKTFDFRRICPFTGKKANRANKVSFSNHKTKKLQFVNLQYKKVWWEAGKRFVKLRLSTKALKTIEKNGLDAVAKKAGIDLRKK